MTERAVVLLSGGLDSTVALWWALRKGWRCSALGFEYGQRGQRETTHARAIARLAEVPYQLVRFNLPWSRSSLTNRAAHLPRRKVEKIPASIPSTYVPGRNTLFLSFAMSLADEIHARRIVIGANAIDYSGYPDCRGPYLNAFESVAQKGTRLGTELNKKIQIAEHFMTFKEHLRRLFPAESIGTNIATWSNRSVEWLCEYHFDIFGLINKGLAISYSDVQPTSNEG